MLFQADIAFAVELLALVAGTSLLVHSCREAVSCRAFAKFIAAIVIILSVLALLCTSFRGYRHWEEGRSMQEMMKGMKEHMLQEDATDKGVHPEH